MSLEEIWAAGFLTGATWSFCNFYFLFRFISKRQFWMLLVKFPALYIAGFYILRTGFFPISAIVVGFSAYIFILAGVWIFIYAKPGRSLMEEST